MTHIRQMVIWIAVLGLINTARLQSEGLPAARATTVIANALSAPNLREVSPGVFALGRVTFCKTARTVSFPIEINQRSNVVEYAVVTGTGKTYESLFKTEADPVQIHLAMLLLGAKPTSTNVLGGDLKTSPSGQRIQVEARWREGGREIRRPLESFLVYSTNLQQTLPRGAWLYNGSYVDRGRFLASLEGSIVSIQEDAMALVNNPRPDRFFDDLHVVNTVLLPPDGVPIEMVFRLAKSAGEGKEAPLPRP
jgi:hypothetical protein